MSNRLYYILDKDNTTMPAINIEAWGKMFSRSDRRVGSDTIEGKYISTVFLGIDHSFDPSELHIFETMVFTHKGGESIFCERYATWVDAEKGHEAACKNVKAGKL